MICHLHYHPEEGRAALGSCSSVLALLLDVGVPEPIPELKRGRRAEVALRRVGRGHGDGRAEEEGYV